MIIVKSVYYFTSQVLVKGLTPYTQFKELIIGRETTTNKIKSYVVLSLTMNRNQSLHGAKYRYRQILMSCTKQYCLNFEAYIRVSQS